MRLLAFNLLVTISRYDARQIPPPHKEPHMTSNRVLSTIFAITGIALVSMLADSPLVTEVEASSTSEVSTKQHQLIEQKLDAEVNNLDDLATLEKAGFATAEIKHMQQLMKHKIAFTRAIYTSQSLQLFEKKLAATVEQMHQLDNLEAKGLAHRDIQNIQQAILHKLGHMQDESFFVSLN
jgi:hypothetical protein